MIQRPLIELSIAKVCKACGESNIVMLAKMGGSPVCKRCGIQLPIADSDRIAGGVMYVFAVAAGENVEVG